MPYAWRTPPDTPLPSPSHRPLHTAVLALVMLGAGCVLVFLDAWFRS